MRRLEERTKALESKVVSLTALVASLLAVMHRDDHLDRDDMREIIIGAQWAERDLGPTLGRASKHPTQIAGLYADAYEDENLQEGVWAAMREVYALTDFQVQAVARLAAEQ